MYQISRKIQKDFSFGMSNVSIATTKGSIQPRAPKCLREISKEDKI